MKGLDVQLNKIYLPLFCTVLFICLMNSSYVRASWISRGPYGGYVNSMAMAANPDVIYAGTESGIFKTADGGTNWTKTGFPDIRVKEVQVASRSACQKIDFDQVTAPCEFAETIALPLSAWRVASFGFWDSVYYCGFISARRADRVYGQA